VTRRPRHDDSTSAPSEYANETTVLLILDKMASIRYDGGMAKRRSRLMTDQLRQAIDDSGLTRYQIAKGTGIDESALAKFYNGHRGLSMQALNALGEYLGLTIIMRRRPNKKER
jgi:hypothetical protein